VPIGAVVLVIIWRTLPTVRDPNAERNIDYLGAALFVAALVPFLIGRAPVAPGGVEVLAD